MLTEGCHSSETVLRLSGTSLPSAVISLLLLQHQGLSSRSPQQLHQQTPSSFTGSFTGATSVHTIAVGLVVFKLLLVKVSHEKQESAPAPFRGPPLLVPARGITLLLPMFSGFVKTRHGGV